MNDEQRVALRGWFDTYIVPSESLDVAGYSGYDGYDFHSEVKYMSQAMSLGITWWNDPTSIPFPNLPLIKEMSLDSISDSEGVIEGFSLAVQVEPVSFKNNPEPVFGFQVLYLSKFLDFKAATNDREATGVEAAWNVVEALAEEWVLLAASVQKIRDAVGIVVPNEEG